jgi:hypothetical protein
MATEDGMSAEEMREKIAIKLAWSQDLAHNEQPLNTARNIILREAIDIVRAVKVE